ncbi:MAG: SGNH/GDSL hydrolase family protein [bacterium]|nr:SGNH/GDSL hydrolase family protein [bacterium]
MGDRELVPRKVEKWAYGGDSIAGSGYRGKNNPKNTDIGTQISEFTNGNIQFDNYGRTSDTTGGMLGQHTVRGKKRDMLSKMLAKPYDGIIIQVGVNDVAAMKWKKEKEWKKYMGKMRENIITMYLRAYLKGAGTGNRSEVLGKIDAAIEKTKKEEAEVRKQLKSQGPSWTLEKTLGILEQGRETLEDVRKVYVRLTKKNKKPGKEIKRMIFVEAGPWKGYKTWGEKEGLRTFEYNNLLEDIGIELNDVFGEMGGPRFELANVYDSLVSSEDEMALRKEYTGRNKEGRDYLHLGPAGREAAAAVIALGHFSEHVTEPQKVEAVAAGNRVGKEKKPGALAKR